MDGRMASELIPAELTLTLFEAPAREAGDAIRKTFRFSGVAAEYKDDGTPNRTPVTVADKQVNALVIQKLRAQMPSPELSITGEEQSDQRKGARYEIFVDPIDGTFPYAAGIPVSTFMIALVTENQPQLACIYDPFGDQLFSAQRGRGATLNGKPISVSTHTTFGGPTIIGSVWWNTSPFNVGQLAGLLPTLTNASIINLLSIGYMGAKVASGEFAATLFPGHNAHDTAALHLLVEEAGGVVTDIMGNPLDYSKPLKGHIAANKALHGQLVELVKKFNPPVR